MLVGFSKGVVVLNQMLLELPNSICSSNCDDDDVEFARSLRLWCWWDGGHEGRRHGRQVYVAGRKELGALVNGIRARVDVRVTPYQVREHLL